MLALVVVVWFAWSLSRGPVSLPFLTAPLAEALTGEIGTDIGLGGTQLVWDKEAQSLQVRAERVTLLGRGGAEIASLPELAVTLAAEPLFRGEVAPSAIRVLRPRLHLTRDADGKVALDLGDTTDSAGTTGVADSLLAQLEAPPGPDNVLGHLQRIEVTDADLTVDDQLLHTAWHAPDADVTLSRNEVGVAARASASLDLGGETARIQASGQYRTRERVASAGLSWTALRPSALAVLGPALQPLAALAFPSDGHAELDYAVDGGLRSAKLSIHGRAGSLDATPWLGQAWPVNALDLDTSLDFARDTLAIDRLRIDLGGPTVQMSGGITGLTGATPAIQLQAEVTSVPLDQIRALWPASLLPDPRDWVVDHLSKGRMNDLTLRMTAHLVAETPDRKGADRLEPDQIDGRIAVEGAQVDYLPPMPPVKGASGTATFDAKGMVITATSGQAAGMNVTGATVTLTGFDLPKQAGVVKVNATGQMPDLLRLLDNKPLSLGSSIGIAPNAVKGQAAVDFTAHIPDLGNVKLDDVKTQATAHISQLALPNALAGVALANGAFELVVDDAGLDATGTAELGGVPATVKWRENFAERAAFRNRYDITATLDDPARRALGLSGDPFQAPWLSGPVPAQIGLVQARDGSMTATISGDLAGTALSLPDLDWSKPAGAAGTVDATVQLDKNGQVRAVPSFAVRAADLDVAGSVGFDGSEARRVGLAHLRYGRTDLAGTLQLAPGGGIRVEMAGPSFDVTPLLGSAPTPATETGTAKTKAAPPVAGPPLDVSLRTDKLWFSKTDSVQAVSAKISRRGTMWRSASISGTLTGGAPLDIVLDQPKPDQRHLVVTTTDGGGFLSTFRLLSNVVGGSLKIDGTFDDSKPGHPLAGSMTVSNYRVVRAPLLARLFTVAAFTGIVDVLTGEGIIFTSMDVPFTLDDGVLTLKDVHASGPSIGITANGQIDLDNDKLAIEGTVVPANLVNSLLGNIPLIGSALVGAKGGGVFAMNYSLKGATDNPEVTVNPLSVLTPGFVRNLFGIFGSDTTVRPATPAADAQNQTPPAPGTPPQTQ